MTIRKGKTIIAGNIPAGYEIGDIGLSAIGIDESLNYRRYLNGQEILQAQFPEFTKKIKRRVELYPSLACSDYQYETYLLTSAHGQCGKFVIDDERGVIRLPKVVNVMGLSDMAEAGVTVEAGLPNITGQAPLGTAYGGNTDFDYTNSALYRDLVNHGYKERNESTGGDLTLFDASRSNPIYGNSETVQQEAIKYPYFIQVASSSETTINLTRDIELNNPFSLFEYKFSEYAIDNISWLESKGQWNSNKVYVSAYEELLAIYNGKVREGVSVKKTTETYTDYDFVIDEAGSTFRLPLKVLGASSKAVAGNGMTLGLTDGTTNVGLGTYMGGDGTHFLNSNNGWYGESVGTSTMGETNSAKDISVGVTTDPTKSGIETSTEGMKLYFYVGETVQDGNLINAGAVLEDVNTLKNTALTTNQITNCITEIPQRVKLELADGVLTLKAGSEVIIPNGFEEDGVTPKFDYVTIEKDSTVSYGGTHTSTGKVCYDKDLDRIIFHWDNSITSGTTTPTKTYSFCYNTTDNKVYNIMEEGTCYQASLPLCQVAVANADGVISSIDQVFNGIGYIGSHVWVDKGVKGLASYGRNEDGTLNNIEYTTKVLTIKQITNASSLFSINLDGSLREYYSPFVYETITEPIVDTHCFWYNPDSNEWNYHTPDTKNWTKFKHIPMGTATLENGVISNFQPKQPFRAINYSDKPEISGWSMPSEKYIDLTLGATGSSYTAPANGWFHLDKVSGDTAGKFISFYNHTKRNGVRSFTAKNHGLWITIPVQKGDAIACTYDAVGTTNYFRFIYAEGEK